jgi:flagellar hook-length control protein FliK
LTGRSLEPDQVPRAPAGARLTDLHGLFTAPPAVDFFTTPRAGSGTVAKGARPSGAAAAADSRIAPAAKQPADEDQAIANNLAWLLACMGTTKGAAAAASEEPGISADAQTAAPVPTGRTGTDAAVAAVARVTASSNAAATGIRTMPSAADQPPVVDHEMTSDAGAVAKKQPPPVGNQPARTPEGTPAATTAQIAALATVRASDPINASPSGSAAASAGAAGAGRDTSARSAIGPARSSAIDAGIASPATNIGAGAPEPVGAEASAKPSGAAARSDAAALGALASTSGARTAPNPSTGSEAVPVEQPPAIRTSTPAAALAGPAAAESGPTDAHGSTKKDGQGSDEARADAPLPRAAVAPSSASVFQLPLDMRAVGGVNTPASVPDAAAAGLSLAVQAELPNQIVQAIRLQWTDGVGDARITLQPEYLGELSIAIRVEHGAVTAALESSVPAVREWIDSHQPMLRQALAAQGLELERLTATDTQATPERKRDEHPEPRQQHDEPKPPRRRTRSDAPVFELIA